MAATRSLVLFVVGADGRRKWVPLTLHDQGGHWSTGDLDLDPCRVYRVIVADQEVPDTSTFDVSPPKGESS